MPVSVMCVMDDVSNVTVGRRKHSRYPSPGVRRRHPSVQLGMSFSHSWSFSASAARMRATVTFVELAFCCEPFLNCNPG